MYVKVKMEKENSIAPKHSYLLNFMDKKTLHDITNALPLDTCCLYKRMNVESSVVELTVQRLKLYVVMIEANVLVLSRNSALS